MTANCSEYKIIQHKFSVVMDFGTLEIQYDMSLN